MESFCHLSRKWKILYQLFTLCLQFAIHKFPISLLHRMLQKFYILNNSFNSIVFALYFCNSIILLSNVKKLLSRIRQHYGMESFLHGIIFLENEKFYIHCMFTSCLQSRYINFSAGRKSGREEIKGVIIDMGVLFIRVSEFSRRKGSSWRVSIDPRYRIASPLPGSFRGI